MDRTVLNALTVDVEDYFQVGAFASRIRPEEWDQWPSRVERNTDCLLALFDAHQVRATFFVLGWIAERYPDLVRRIRDQGHEVASHGYSHQLVYNQSPETFRDEAARSKALLEDILGEPVTGYRAASYSITPKSRWALDILVELGFTWDSSLFPIRHDVYGMPGTPVVPYRLETDNGGELVEFPLSTVNLLGQTLPIAGGGYFRLFPYWFSRWGLDSINRRQEPFIFYLHPWEIDPEQPRVDNISTKSRFRHYNNLARCYGRLERLLTKFRFGAVTDVLAEKDLTPANGTLTGK
ncbi:MAG: XrtA system polysaccharide deacetylase [Aquisalimonadaceae bacterium]